MSKYVWYLFNLSLQRPFWIFLKCRKILINMYNIFIKFRFFSYKCVLRKTFINIYLWIFYWIWIICICTKLRIFLKYAYKSNPLMSYTFRKKFLKYTCKLYSKNLFTHLWNYSWIYISFYKFMKISSRFRRSL